MTTVMTTEPCGCPTGAHDDGDPGGFYVTVKDTTGRGERTGWLAGPYATHGEALAEVRDVKRLAQAVNTRAVWYAFGTSRILTGPRPDGLLNGHLAAWRAAILPDGTPVRYLKSGKGTIAAHTCTPQSCAEPGEWHSYRVAFTTGRYKGTERDVWLSPADAIPGEE